MAKDPYPFQIPAIELGSRSNLLLMDDCGLGKTFVGAEIMRNVMEPGDNLPGLIVCPKAVRWQWLATLYEQIPDIPRRVLALHDSFDSDELRRRQEIVIVHYEAMMRHKDELSNLLWRVLICDEAHRIRNRQADRSGVIKDIPAKRRIALTGTPMEKTPADLWSILNWLYPFKYPGYHSFFGRYAMTEPTFRHFFRVVPGCKDPEGLAKELAPFALRRTREECAPWLPPVTETVVPLMMAKKQAELYETIDRATDILVDLGDDDPLLIRNGLAKIVKLQQVTSNPRLVGASKFAVPSVKEDWVIDYVTDNPTEPIIIFCQFRDTASQLAERLRAFTPKRYIGGDQLPPTTKDRLIVGTIGAAGEGLDLPHIRTAIFVDTVWSYTKMTQARDRIQRLSNIDTKHIIYLQVPGTVDELVFKAYSSKWTSHELVFELLKRVRGERSELLTVDD